MNNSYHIFVIITTIIIYIFLNSKKERDSESESSAFMYIFYVPIVLYGGYYFLNTPKSISKAVSDVSINSASQASSQAVSHVVSQASNLKNFHVPSEVTADLLSEPFPSSSGSI